LTLLHPFDRSAASDAGLLRRRVQVPSALNTEARARRYPSGKIVYVLQYRMPGGGTTKTFTIGAHGSPSPALYLPLSSSPFQVSITGRHQHSRHDVELAFWGPQTMIFDANLAASEKLRLISHAEEADLLLID
jgi:hypothetical protein